MLKLPLEKLHRLGALFKSDGQIEKILKVWCYHNPLLRVCFIKSSTIPKDNIDDIFHIYIIDMWKCDVVGVRGDIHQSRRYVDPDPIWCGSNSLNIKYSCNRLRKRSSNYYDINGWSAKEILPFGINEELEISRLVKDYKKNITESRASPYEQWIINYFGRLAFLYSIQKASNGWSTFAKESNITPYVKEVKKVETQLLNELDELFNNYPRD